jgi:hypothetical protein
MDRIFTGSQAFDLLLKAIIGGVIAIVSWDYRSVKNHLEELQTARYENGADLTVVKSQITYIKERVDSIDKKLDRAIK